ELCLFAFKYALRYALPGTSHSFVTFSLDSTTTPKEGTIRREPHVLFYWYDSAGSTPEVCKFDPGLHSCTAVAYGWDSDA
ncbi:hypothetical protein HGRIS_014756, partial [Hohenbuehelia grisea]